MEDLHRMKKKFIVDFESKLCYVGKKFLKELESRYNVDKQLINNHIYDVCFKLENSDSTSQEDRNKIKKFIKLYYCLENMKSTEY